MYFRFARTVAHYEIAPLEPRRLLTALLSDQTVIGSISGPTEVDSYEINLTAGEPFLVSLSETTQNAPLQPMMRVIAPDGSTLTTQSGDRTATADIDSVPLTGEYRIEISDSTNQNTGEYRLTAAGLMSTQMPSDGDGGVILSGQRRFQTQASGDLDVFQMDIVAGDTAILISTSTALVIFDPVFQRVTLPNQYSARHQFVATSTGTYHIVSVNTFYSPVQQYACAAFKSTGVLYDDATDDDAGTIASGMQLYGSIAEADLDVVEVAAEAGDRLVFTIGVLPDMAGNDDFETQVQVFGPSGNAFSIPSSLGNQGESFAIHAGVSGTYRFVIHDDIFHYTGDYSFSLAKSKGAFSVDENDPDTTNIRSGERKYGTLTLGDSDIVTLSATAGEIVALSVADLEETFFRPKAYLYRPSGSQQVLNYEDESVNASFTATESGEYRLIIADGHIHYSPTHPYFARYAITMIKSTGEMFADPTDLDGGSLVSGQIRNGSFTFGDWDAYTIDATHGVPMTIRLTDLAGGEDGVPRLNLFHPNGSFISGNEADVTAQITFTPAVTGAYRVMAFDRSWEESNSAAFDYQIDVDVTSNPSDLVAPIVTFGHFNPETQEILVYTSERVLDLTSDDFVLTNATTNQTIDDLEVSFNSRANRITITRADLAVLPDGSYTLSLPQESVVDLAGNLQTTPFTLNFHQLAGDVDGNGVVGFSDLLIVAQNYGRTHRTLATGNADRSAGGEVGFSDLLLVAQQYGTSVLVAKAKPRIASDRIERESFLRSVIS